MVGAGDRRVDFLQAEGLQPASVGPKCPLRGSAVEGTRGGEEDPRRGEKLQHVFPAEGTESDISAEPPPPSRITSLPLRQPPALPLSI